VLDPDVAAAVVTHNTCRGIFRVVNCAKNGTHVQDNMSES
jgi:hypothetical protein